MTRADRWTRITRALEALERHLDAEAAAGRLDDERLLDAVHRCTSHAGHARDGDAGYDPPPRGEARALWCEEVRPALPREAAVRRLAADVRAAGLR